jgi:hypothetical protein
LLLVLGAIAAIAGFILSAEHAPTAAKPAPATAAVAVVVTPAPAAPVAATPARDAQVAPSTVAGAAGMRIYKDPDSDEIGPPTAGATALESDGTSEDMTGLQTVTLPDGSIMVDLQGRFQEAMVVQIDAHGKRVMTCTRDVKKTLSHPPVSQARREER